MAVRQIVTVLLLARREGVEARVKKTQDGGETSY
jgi:hypothetical protein